MTALVAEGLTRRFGAHLAVDGLDLEVARGEVFGFLGPNGAGKTTTIRMFCALLRPDAGRTAVLGRWTEREPDAVRRSVGILTESPGVYERLTVAQNLAFFAELYGVDDADVRVRSLLERLGLWERRHTLAGALSRGMRQKLAIARALIHDPPVVFLDEPTAALDPEAAAVVRDLIVALREQGRTVFLCTHILSEAERLCDRVAVFRTRLLAVDTPAGLRRALSGAEVAFELAAWTPALEATLADVPGVEAVRREEGRLYARIGAPEAVGSAVRALVLAGGDVRQVVRTERTLEDAYLALMSRGTP